MTEKTSPELMSALAILAATKRAPRSPAPEPFPDGPRDAEIARLRTENAELLAVLKEVVRISDRKHDAWYAAHAVIAKANQR
jgi:hypothetical protein